MRSTNGITKINQLTKMNWGACIENDIEEINIDQKVVSERCLIGNKGLRGVF